MEAVPDVIVNSASSVPIKVGFDKTTAFVGCIQARGVCTNDFESRSEWLNYQLQANEAKGEAWVEQMSDTTSSINYCLNNVKLSPQLFSQLVNTRKLSFDEDTYIPNSLLSKMYKNTSIKNKPADLKIAKGDYAVRLKNPPPTPVLGSQLTIIIKVRVRCTWPPLECAVEVDIEITF